MARPINLVAYGAPDAADLAAAYAFDLARNHGFSDGNKRSAWVVARLFLMANGRELNFEQADALHMVLDLAAGKLTEAQVATWFRERIVAG